MPIVSTTEELAYPQYTQKRLAARIDAAARKAKVAVLGTGVNPGFTMDALPITLTGVCESVDIDHGQPDPGRAVAPPAVPAEDWLRPDARAVPVAGGRR